MRLETKHFAFYCGRDWTMRPRWYRRSIRIAFRGIEHAEFESPYRWVIGLDFSLIPNFIWYQDVIRQQIDYVELQARIIGVQGWPFRFGVSRY